MPFPTIPNPAPVTKPAVEAKEYTGLSMIKLLIEDIDREEGGFRGSIEVCPSHPTTNEKLRGEKTRIVVADFEALAAARAADEKPLMQQAMGALYLAIAEYATEYIAAQNPPQPELQPE